MINIIPLDKKYFQTLVLALFYQSRARLRPRFSHSQFLISLMSFVKSSFKVVKPAPSRSKTLKSTRKVMRRGSSPILDKSTLDFFLNYRHTHDGTFHVDDPERWVNKIKRRRRKAFKEKYPSFSPPVDDHSGFFTSSDDESLDLNIETSDDSDFEFIPELSHPPVIR